MVLKTHKKKFPHFGFFLLVSNNLNWIFSFSWIINTNNI
jgi:hypothetical protein